jgi:hypothetical protein
MVRPVRSFGYALSLGTIAALGQNPTRLARNPSLAASLHIPLDGSHQPLLGKFDTIARGESTQVGC